MADRVFVGSISVWNPDDEDGTQTVYRQGDLLPDWVGAYQRFVLRSTGMVKFEPDQPEAAPGSDNPTNPAPVRLAEHPPLGSRLAASEQNTAAGIVSQRMRDEAGSSRDVAPDGSDESDEGDPAQYEAPDEGDPAPDEGERPSTSAPKAEWVDYAVTKGTDRSEAEASTKAELVERFGIPR
jgi:hypothetical protein